MGFGILVDIVIALFIAMNANNKGRSFGFWFVVSVVFDPIIGFILLQLACFISSIFKPKVHVPLIDFRPDNNFDHTSEAPAAQELYRRSTLLSLQAAKYRELADQMSVEKRNIVWKK